MTQLSAFASECIEVFGADAFSEHHPIEVTSFSDMALDLRKFDCSCGKWKIEIAVTIGRLNIAQISFMRHLEKSV